MSDVPHWTDIVVAVAAIIALVISVASAVIAWTARKDSKKSADAAEKSAKEAEIDRRINQSNSLTEHFADVSYFFDVVGFKSAVDDAKLQKANNASKRLKDILSDTELAELLDKLFQRANNLSPDAMRNIFRISSNSKSVSADPELAALTETFNLRKRQHLNIS